MVFPSVYILDTSRKAFLPEKLTATLTLTTEKGNKSAGYFDICPTDILNGSLSPKDTQLKIPLDKCPDKKACILATLSFKPIKELSEWEFK